MSNITPYQCNLYIFMLVLKECSLQEALEKETEAERDLRQQQDFEQIQKSYAELESTYTKFLSDSGLSRGGYWRSGVHQLQEDV